MKTILVIIPFENIYPPMSGGMLRGFNLLHQLSRFCKVTVIINQDKHSFLESTGEYPAIKNCTVISTAGTKEPMDLFSLLPVKLRKALRFRFWNRSVKGPAENNFLTMYPILKKLLKQEVFDFVLLEDMSILNIARLVRGWQPAAEIIYDAYNVNTRLAKVSLSNKEITQKNFDQILKAETSLSGSIDKVFTCSDMDLQQLTEMNNGRLSGTVIPNGVTIPLNNHIQQPHSKDDIIFCGSMDYLPNKEGLLWFCKEVFPLLLQAKPSVRLLVVGKGDPGIELAALLRQERIINYGMVDSVSDYYKKASVALVPLLSGSGTRLKLLEAMGHRLPVVATSIGAEGIHYTDGENIMIADAAAGFADKIIQLLNNSTLADSIAAEAFSFVQKKYDWNIIGERMAAYLNSLKN